MALIDLPAVSSTFSRSCSSSVTLLTGPYTAITPALAGAFHTPCSRSVRA